MGADVALQRQEGAGTLTAGTLTAGSGNKMGTLGDFGRVTGGS
jgi:hypothetical protein